MKSIRKELLAAEQQLITEKRGNRDRYETEVHDDASILGSGN
jgi:hypothetical protein